MHPNLWIYIEEHCIHVAWCEILLSFFLFFFLAIKLTILASITTNADQVSEWNLSFVCSFISVNYPAHTPWCLCWWVVCKVPWYKRVSTAGQLQQSLSTSICFLRATPPLEVARGTGKEKVPEGRWMGLQRGQPEWRWEPEGQVREGLPALQPEVGVTPGLTSAWRRALFKFFVSGACPSLSSGGASADSISGHGARAPVSPSDRWEATWLPTVRSISTAL